MQLNRSTPRNFLWATAVILILVLAMGAGWWLLQRADTQAQVREQLIAARASFPIFYVDSLPEGVSVVGESVQARGGVVMFGLNKAGNQITVTQQPKPKLMEEVSKLEDVPVATGKAYVAKMNERVVGFLVTDTTLLLVSSTQPLGSETLAAILKNFVKL